MSLQDLDLRAEYRTKITNISNDLIVPLLSEAVVYRRAVGFFSSSALLEVSKGIGALIKNGGKMQLVASPNLSEEDIEAINRGYGERDKIIRSALVRELPSLESLSEEQLDRFNLLANLIATGVLDIRIAFIEGQKGVGIYHEKLGIVEDSEGNIVAFDGSMNESQTAMRENYEVVNVFRSWFDAENRVPLKKAAFTAIWGDYEPGIVTCEYPEVAELIQKRYFTGEPKVDLDAPRAKRISQASSPSVDYEKHPFGIPTIPPENDDFEIRDYQTKAVEEWVSNDYRGIFDMATGTGKTITALLALERLYRQLDGDLLVIIACPYQHLVEQWCDDLAFFKINPIVAHSGKGRRKWPEKLRYAILDKKLGAAPDQFICLITTNATLASDRMQNELSRYKGNVLLIADEAHNLGAPGYQKVLNQGYSYRLALSATMNRHHDESGTQYLYAYFEKECISYPINRAIREGMLCEYKYHPVICIMSAAELDAYEEKTRELGKPNCQTRDSTGKVVGLSKHGELVAQERARIVAAASSKLVELERAIGPYRKDNHILVYCGAAQLLEEGRDSTEVLDSDLRQITQVVNLLSDKSGLNMDVSKFTSEESIEERKILIQNFRNAIDMQALIAIKCLDEGVNVPNIRTAFMLASTTNPKEYIQRRGRLLRTAPGKDFADIYDFITLPYSCEFAAGQPISELRTVYRLVCNELERWREFADYSINWAEAHEMMDNIRESFRVDEITQEMEEERDAF